MVIDGTHVSDFAFLQNFRDCRVSLLIGPNEHCRLFVLFSPSAPGLREATLRIGTTAEPVPRSIRLYGHGASPGVSSSLLPRFVAPETDFVADLDGAGFLMVANPSAAAIVIESITIDGPDSHRFTSGGGHPGLSSQPCLPSLVLAASGGHCALVLRLSSGPPGRYSTDAVFRFAGFAEPYRMPITAYLRTPRRSPDYATLTSRYAFEYYHAQYDHYFMTALELEIDDMAFRHRAGWAPTGRSFEVHESADPATSPVCRFYIPPALGDSHFYSASPVECAEVRTKFPALVYESAAVMHASLPDLATGACPPGTHPVFRVWNQRGDSNHRYTTDRNVRDAMIARGYVAEGYGPDGVAMCAPA